MSNPVPEKNQALNDSLQFVAGKDKPKAGPHPKEAKYAATGQKQVNYLEINVSFRQ